MANGDIRSRGAYRYVDKRRTQSPALTLVEPSTALIATGNGKDITAMRARLTAINAVTYTADVLNKMTVNDMTYAIMLNDDPTSGVNG